MADQPFTRLEEILDGFLKPVEMMMSAAEPDDLDSQFLHKTAQMLVRNMEEAIDIARNRQKKMVWYEFSLTPELFHAFDLYPIAGEIIPMWYSLFRQDFVSEFVDAAENSGLPPEVCSIDKVLVGAILQDEMPKPDMLITSSAPCDSSRIGYQLMEKLFDMDIHKLDAPSSNDAAAFKYYADQIRDLIPALEKLSGVKFDIDRLREVVDESNRAIEYIVEWNDLRMLKPCPTPANLWVPVYNAVINSFGKADCTDYSRQVYEYARERADKGMAEGEKIRVVWVHVPPLFDDVIFNWMTSEYGAVVVDHTLAEYTNQVPIDTSSLDSMLVGLAQRGLNMTMARLRRTAGSYVDDFLKSYRNFSGDCAILAAHSGCKHCWASANLLRDAARKEDIPLLIFDIDFLDSRVTSTQGVQDKIEQFFSTMEL
jgi:benzoyl-CoA reductase subunit B